MSAARPRRPDSGSGTGAGGAPNRRRARLGWGRSADDIGRTGHGECRDRRRAVDVLDRDVRQVGPLAHARAEPGHDQRVGAEVVEEVAGGRHLPMPRTSASTAEYSASRSLDPRRARAPSRGARWAAVGAPRSAQVGAARAASVRASGAARGQDGAALVGAGGGAGRPSSGRGRAAGRGGLVGAGGGAGRAASGRVAVPRRGARAHGGSRAAELGQRPCRPGGLRGRLPLQAAHPIQEAGHLGAQPSQLLIGLGLCDLHVALRIDGRAPVHRGLGAAVPRGAPVCRARHRHAARIGRARATSVSTSAPNTFSTQPSW